MCEPLMNDPMYNLAFFLAMTDGKLDPDEPPNFSDPNDEYNYENYVDY